jgi:hypothetical protein
MLSCPHGVWLHMVGVRAVDAVRAAAAAAAAVSSVCTSVGAARPPCTDSLLGLAVGGECTGAWLASVGGFSVQQRSLPTRQCSWLRRQGLPLQGQQPAPPQLLPALAPRQPRQAPLPLPCRARPGRVPGRVPAHGRRAPRRARPLPRPQLQHLPQAPLSAALRARAPGPCIPESQPGRCGQSKHS